MIALFARPTSPLRLAAVAFAICSIIALYCLAYSALSGQSESIGQAFGWTLVNVVPWLLAVEVGKRGYRLAFVLAVLAAAFIGSLVLGLSLAGSGGDFAFEALRRVPGLAVTASLIGLLRFLNARQARSAEMSAGLPLPAEQIDWV
ncbi:MAG: hypothetical protein ACXW2T_02135, partial [Allosphingosinicella sp.]